MNISQTMFEQLSQNFKSTFDANFDQQEIDTIVESLNSGEWWMGTHGNPSVMGLEKQFAKFHQTHYALAVTNGSHALEIILRNLGIQAGAEVILPAYAPTSTAMAVLMVGATPVFVDVERNTMTLDPQLVEAAISRNTQAILTVHLNGVASNIIQLVQLARHHKLYLVEDCSHAHGASFRGRRVGSFGIAGAFDFQSDRLITGGEGGMIITHNRSLYQQCWSQHNCGRRLGKPRNRYFNVGTNYRMTAFQAALIQIKLKRFIQRMPDHLAHLVLLDYALTQIPGITPQHRHDRLQAPAQGYYFRYDAESFGGLSRDRFILKLQDQGIPAQSSPISALSQFPIFQSQGKFEVAESLEKTVICLPHPQLLSDASSVSKIYQIIGQIQEDTYQNADQIDKQAVNLQAVNTINTINTVNLQEIN